MTPFENQGPVGPVIFENVVPRFHNLELAGAEIKPGQLLYRGIDGRLYPVKGSSLTMRRRDGEKRDSETH
jgi:hypothetical protein